MSVNKVKEEEKVVDEFLNKSNIFANEKLKDTSSNNEGKAASSCSNEGKDNSLNKESKETNYQTDDQEAVSVAQDNKNDDLDNSQGSSNLEKSSAPVETVSAPDDQECILVVENEVEIIEEETCSKTKDEDLNTSEDINTGGISTNEEEVVVLKEDSDAVCYKAVDSVSPKDEKVDEIELKDTEDLFSKSPSKDESSSEEAIKEHDDDKSTPPKQNVEENISATKLEKTVTDEKESIRKSPTGTPDDIKSEVSKVTEKQLITSQTPSKTPDVEVETSSIPSRTVDAPDYSADNVDTKIIKSLGDCKSSEEETAVKVEVKDQKPLVKVSKISSDKNVEKVSDKKSQTQTGQLNSDVKGKLYNILTYFN